MFNLYGYGRPPNAIRRHNLTHYLGIMVEHKPTILLMGEAPGYRGGRLTGIPFTSPAILKNGRLFTSVPGFQRPDEWPRIQNEATATIIWATLADLRRLPLFWNAFPFHPHKLAHSQSNRTPTRTELAAGEFHFHQLMAIFPIEQVAAVGNQAAIALHKWGIPSVKIRHPSHGGKQQFVTEVRRLLA